jgi:hypothetical protein
MPAPAQTVISSSDPLGIVRVGAVCDDAAGAVFGCDGAIGGVAVVACVLSTRAGWARVAGLAGATALETPACVVGDNMPLSLAAKGKQTVN